jgi:hypothetical protein
MGDKTTNRRRDRLRLAGLGGRTIGMIAALILAVAAADRSGLSLDLSPDGRYTLDPDLVQIISSQTADTRIIALWPNNSGQEAIEEGLRLMAAKSPHLSLTRIDPIIQQPLYQKHQETYGDGSWPAIYLTRDTRAFKIPIGPTTRRVLQREVGGGLLSLADPKPPTARFLTGHGELTTTGGLDGIDALVRALELTGFKTVVSNDPTIDAESVVILAGPTAPYGKQTLTALNQHLIDGGSLLVFADDRIPADLAALLRRWGLLIGPGMPKALREGNLAALLEENPAPADSEIVVSRSRHAVLQEAEFPYANLLIDKDQMSDHPSMASLGEANRVLLSPWTTPVSRLVLDPQHDQEILQAMATRGLLPPFAEMPAVLFVGAPGDTWTTARSEAPKVPADLDKHGPIPLAVAAVYESNPASARQGEQARIIVWGSRAAASNGVLVRNEFTNADLSVDLAR